MKPSPSWEINQFSGSQEIPPILWNPKVYYRIHKSPHLSPSRARSILSLLPHSTFWRSILILYIYLLTAVVLTPGGSSTVHIYTQTVHRTTQLIWVSILTYSMGTVLLEKLTGSQLVEKYHPPPPILWNPKVHYHIHNSPHLSPSRAKSILPVLHTFNFLKIYLNIIDMIYLLTAFGLTPGDSSTVHIYTQTVHRTTQLIWKQCGPCTVFVIYTVAFALQLRKKHGKTSVRVAEECQLARWKQNIQNRTYITIKIHKFTKLNKSSFHLRQVSLTPTKGWLTFRRLMSTIVVVPHR